MPYAQPPSSTSDHGPSEPAQAALPASELDPRDQAVLQALRQRRSTLAREAQIPLYWIASNATLVELAATRPATLAGLRKVRGFGPARCERYGQALLDEIKSAAEAQGLSVADPPEGALAPAGPKLPAKWRSAARELFEAGSPLLEVCLRCDVRPSAALEELLAVVRVHGARDLQPWLAEDQRQRVTQAAERLGWKPLTPLYEALDGEVSYPLLRLCRGFAHGPGEPWAD